MMPTKQELFNQLKFDIAKGEGQHPVHMVEHVKERARKRDNPKKSTKMILNCRTPEQWSEMQMQKERYFDAAKDPQIVIDLMIRALSAFGDNVLRDWVQQGHDVGPPRANIPKWAE